MTRAGPGGHHGPESPNPAAKAPTPDGATFRDLLIFEERLKQNAARLLRRKQKYQTMLALLSGAILFLSYHVLLVPKSYPPLHYAQLTLLVVCCTILFLFFASGMYAERIVAANRFVPQANRALRPFNMYLNTRPPSNAALWKRWIPLAGQQDSVSIQPISGNSNSKLVRSSASDPSSPTGSTPTVRRVPIPPIPPSKNPRGEIIFSSRVSPGFREGYERYRNAFEKRRAEKLEAAAHEASWRIARWWRRTTARIRERRRTSRGGSGLDYEKAEMAGAATPKSGTTAMDTPTIVLGRFGPGSGSSDAGVAASGDPRRGLNRHRSDSSTSIASTASAASTSSNRSGGSSAGSGQGRRKKAKGRTRASQLSQSEGGSGGGDGSDISSSRRSSASSLSSTGGVEDGSQGETSSAQRHGEHESTKASTGNGKKKSTTAASTAESSIPETSTSSTLMMPPPAADPSSVAAQADLRSEAESTLREPLPSEPGDLEGNESGSPKQTTIMTIPGEETADGEADGDGDGSASDGSAGGEWIEVVRRGGGNASGGGAAPGPGPGPGPVQPSSS